MKIVSGIQPTGSIHIGNYIGAIKNWIELQKENDCFFFIADLHALTSPYNPEDLQKNILEIAAAYLAAGLDPAKSSLFVQSKIKEHAELCWILSTVCPVGDLQRMTQYKEKSKSFKKNINAGLLTYPILQAADILLYKAIGVPVGKDQVQHIELARTIARKFNQKYKEDIFPEPKDLLPKMGEKIMSLADPKQKMSKSLGPNHYLSIFAEPEEIEKKIMSAVTDTGKEIKYNLKKKAGISNLLTIAGVFSGKPIPEIEKEFEDKGYAQFKKYVAETLIKSLSPLRQKKAELLSNESKIKEILEAGSQKARAIAQQTISQVKQKIGLT
jgi:tryptophanyl-tRNA synthetase